MTWLLTALRLALCAFFLVEVARKLGPVERAALRGTRPWACNLCMSLWSSGAWTLAALGAGYDEGARVPALWCLFTWPATGALCLLLIQAMDSIVAAKAPPL